MIKIRYSAVDGVSKRKSFKTLAGARKYAIAMLGPYPSFGSYYAVSDDGIGKIEVIEGVRMRQLFGNYPEELKSSEDEQDAALWEAELREQAEYERAFKAEMEEANKILRAYRIAGCTCSEQQLNLVGCDCAATRGGNQ